MPDRIFKKVIPNLQARALAALGALALCAGCASPAVHFDYDSHATFAGYHSFAWQSDANAGDGGRGGFDNPIMDARVRRIVEAELGAKGFTRTNPGSSDFLVTYFPVAEGSRGGRVHLGLGLGLGPLGIGIGAPVGPGPGPVGGIVLEMQDARTRALVWKATAEGALQGADSPEEAESEVREAVHSMLKKFPPQA